MHRERERERASSASSCVWFYYDSDGRERGSFCIPWWCAAFHSRHLIRNLSSAFLIIYLWQQWCYKLIDKHVVSSADLLCLSLSWSWCSQKKGASPSVYTFLLLLLLVATNGVAICIHGTCNCDKRVMRNCSGQFSKKAPYQRHNMHSKQANQLKVHGVRYEIIELLSGLLRCSSSNAPAICRP